MKKSQQQALLEQFFSVYFTKGKITLNQKSRVENDHTYNFTGRSCNAKI